MLKRSSLTLSLADSRLGRSPLPDVKLSLPETISDRSHGSAG